jgi:putative redox protein
MPDTMPVATSVATTITHEGGLAFSANVRGHQLFTDQPASAGGEDRGPTPLELIGAALGTCVALYVTQFCNAREISAAGLRVDVTGHKAKAPYRMGSYDVQLTLPFALPPELHEAAQRVAHSCAVHNTLTSPPEIRISTAPARAVS